MNPESIHIENGLISGNVRGKKQIALLDLVDTSAVDYEYQMYLEKHPEIQQKEKQSSVERQQDSSEKSTPDFGELYKKAIAYGARMAHSPVEEIDKHFNDKRYIGFKVACGVWYAHSEYERLSRGKDKEMDTPHIDDKEVIQAQSDTSDAPSRQIKTEREEVGRKSGLSYTIGSVIHDFNGGGLQHAERAKSKRSTPTMVSTIHTAKYQYPKLDLDITEVYKTRTKYETIVYKDLKDSYNKLIDYKNEHDIKIEGFVPFTAPKGISLRGLLLELREARDHLYMELSDYAIKNGVEPPNVDIHNHSTELIQGRETYEEVTERYNKERGLSVFDENGDLIIASTKNARFYGSYCGYALSKDEQEQLARGDSIILTEVADSSNTEFMNVKCKLVPLDIASPLRNESVGALTHTLLVTEHIDVLADEFADENHNEKYRRNKSYYDALISSVKTHDAEYVLACDRNLASAKRMKKTVAELKKITETKNAVQKSEKANGVKGGVLKVVERDYFIPSYINSGRGLSGPIVFHRNANLIEHTKERLSAKPASRLGSKKYGFETAYDEKLMKSRLSYYSTILKRKTKVLDLCVNEANRASVEKCMKTYEDLYDLVKKEKEYRQMPPENAKYKKMGVKNHWEEYVLDVYKKHQAIREHGSLEERQQVNSEKGLIMDNHKKRVDLALKLRAKLISDSDVAYEEDSMHR